MFSRFRQVSWRRCFTTSEKQQNVKENKNYLKSFREKIFLHGSRMKTTLMVIGTLGTMSAIGWVVFREKFRSVAVREATVITQKSLEDKELQDRVNAIAAASSKMILEDPLVYAKLITLLKVVANDPQITQSTSKLLRDAISTAEFKQILVTSLSELLQDEQTQQVVNKVAKKIVQNLLRDELLKKELIEYLQSVARDTQLQETVGNSLWVSTKVAFLPRFFR